MLAGLSGEIVPGLGQIRAGLDNADPETPGISQGLASVEAGLTGEIVPGLEEILAGLDNADPETPGIGQGLASVEAGLSGEIVPGLGQIRAGLKDEFSPGLREMKKGIDGQMVPGLGKILDGINKEMQTTFRNVRLKVADINARVEDSISGVRVVKSFTNEWYEKEKFERDNLNFRRSKQKSFRVMAQFFSGINLFSNLISLIVLFFGGYFIYRGELTLGVLVGFLLYVNMFLQPIRRISVLVETYQRGMAGFHRFVETLQIEPEIVDHKEARPAGRLKGEIVFDNVTFSYNRDKNILEDISLRIAPGETVALVGPSGAGKTTLCNLIPRFYDLQKGSIKTVSYTHLGLSLLVFTLLKTGFELKARRTEDAHAYKKTALNS